MRLQRLRVRAARHGRSMRQRSARSLPMPSASRTRPRLCSPRRPAKMLRSTHRDSYRHLPRHHPRWPGPRPECRWRRSAHGCQRRVDLGAERSNEAQAPGPLFGRRDRSRGRGRVGRHPLDRVRRRVGAGRCWRTRRRRCSPRSRSRCWPSTLCRRGSTAGLLITVIALGRRSKASMARNTTTITPVPPQWWTPTSVTPRHGTT